MAAAVENLVRRETFPERELSPEEVVRRMAVLKRFRELLIQQRNRFREYLEVLDKQKDVIERGSAEDLITHVEMEERIVADIFSIQKVIDPLEAMYDAAYPERSEAADLPDLKAALEGLKTEAVVRSERNKELLSRRMAELRSEIKLLRKNPYAIRRSLYTGHESAVLVDIKG